MTCFQSGLWIIQTYWALFFPERQTIALLLQILCALSSKKNKSLSLCCIEGGRNLRDGYIISLFQERGRIPCFLQQEMN